MNRAVRGISLFILVFLISLSAVGQTKPEDAAKQSAEAWLALIDSGKYSHSWDEASQMFKTAITKDQWESTLHTVRDPLGKLVTRTLKSANYTKTLPGAPDGEYVVIQYETTFANKGSAVETIVPMLDKDGKWRVSGYFIK